VANIGYHVPMTKPNDHRSQQVPADRDELRWLWIRVGVRLGVGLLVVIATLWLIFLAG
jgi:hypothetical protein